MVGPAIRTPGASRDARRPGAVRALLALASALALALAADAAPAGAAPAKLNGDRACSPTGVDACPAGGAGRLGIQVRGAAAAGASAIAPPTAGGETVAGPAVFTGYGFDACTAPSARAMSAWRASSPFQAVGVYIGGRNRACSQPNLTSAWVAEQVAAGWHLIPTYVGLQATTTSCTSCARLSPGFAVAQARAEADDAVAAARAIGIGPGSPIYHDMESYARTTSATASTMTFLGAWTKRLHELGYASGVYSSSASGIRDLAARWGNPSFDSPDNIWTANWNGRADTADPYIPDEAWPDHQRIHQYRGGHDETWGGVRINIDSNYVDAMTVGSLNAALSEPPPLAISAIKVERRKLWVRVSCGWSADLVCPGQIRLRTNVRTNVRRARGRVLGFSLRRVGVAYRPFRLRGGKSHRFGIVLDGRRGRPLLAKRGRLRAQLLVAVPGSRKTRAVLFRR